MILLRKDEHWRDSVIINGVSTPLKFVLIPGSKNFNSYVNNNVDLKKLYDKIQIRSGSIVRLSDDPNDYFYGFEDEMSDILGTEHTICKIYEDGGVTFENPFDIATLDFSEFGITEIIETIKY